MATKRRQTKRAAKAKRGATARRPAARGPAARARAGGAKIRKPAAGAGAARREDERAQLVATMKAAAIDRFGPPSVLRTRTLPVPECGPDDVLIAMQAAGVGIWDAKFRDGEWAEGKQRFPLVLGTDGDMASVGVIAHEMGHAVAMQLGHISRSSYKNESTADCLAGAFTQQAGRDSSLEKGDIEEAFFGMSLAGDPTPEPTGNARYDAMIQARLARESHGTKEQRTENFRAGLVGGARACLAEFR